MDPFAEAIDYSKYDLLLLGGDLTWLTSESTTSMDYVDSFFDLGSENTLWSLGNHDYSDLQLVESYTGRKPYNASYKNGITFLVLDTQDSTSNITSEQLNLLQTVKDTLDVSSHLILMSHKLIWMYDHPELHQAIDSVSNGPFGTCSFCLNTNNFYNDVYPILQEIKEGGTHVICLAGDIGKKVNEFEFKTSDDIYLLASGIDAGELENKVLLFNHNIEDQTLCWEFVPLNKL